MTFLDMHSENKLLSILCPCFEKHMLRHSGFSWLDVDARLYEHPDKLDILQTMEDTGGEPDVIGQDKKTGEFLFVDCAPESPKGRRSVCYDP